MKKINLFILMLAVATLNVAYAQLEIKPNGNIGIGSVTNPTSRFELDNNQWLRFNVPNSTAGILFYETQGSTPSDVEYGAKIYYNEDVDALLLQTRQSTITPTSLYIKRQTGNVTIGGTTTDSYYKLYVFGNIYATGTITSSDLRLKKDVINIKTDQINKLQYLQPKSYILNYENCETNLSNLAMLNDTASSEYLEKQRKKFERTQYGFVAQELKTYFPELVVEDDAGYLGIDYTSFIPLLVEAYNKQNTDFKQQQAAIDELKAKNAELEQMMQELLKKK